MNLKSKLPHFLNLIPWAVKRLAPPPITPGTYDLNLIEGEDTGTVAYVYKVHEGMVFYRYTPTGTPKSMTETGFRRLYTRREGQ